MFNKTMDKLLLKQVLKDNQEEVEHYQVFGRDIDLDSFPCYVLVGVRRAGKSFLLFQKMQDLLRKGHTWRDMLYLSFEDDRLTGFTSSDFNLILECHAEMGGNRPVLFLDEVQNVPGWETFARRLADAKYHVYITGSNAKMLSSETMTTLGGRYLPVEVYPFNLKEYLAYRNIGFDAGTLLSTNGRATMMREYGEFLQWGGMPEGIGLPVKREYLSSTLQRIYLGDIASRYKIANPLPLRLLAKKLAESVKQPVSYNRLSQILSRVEGKISVPTVSSYLRFCEDAWLILRLRNIASAFSEKETKSKYYFVDNGLLHLFLQDADTSLLENAVALELFRRYGHDQLSERVFFYQAGIEVDFVVPDEELAIQASYSVTHDQETFKRETEALGKLCKVRPCKHRLIITYDEEDTINDAYGTIEVLPYWKWVLQSR